MSHYLKNNIIRESSGHPPRRLLHFWAQRTGSSELAFWPKTHGCEGLARASGEQLVKRDVLYCEMPGIRHCPQFLVNIPVLKPQATL